MAEVGTPTECVGYEQGSDRPCVHATRTAGTARLPPDWPQRSSPYLFDTSSMPKRESVCTHCPVEKAPLCCGVCIFENRLCDTFYPGQNKSQAVVDFLVAGGHRLRVRAAPHPRLWTVGLPRSSPRV